jgi:hypothetical protein
MSYANETCSCLVLQPDHENDHSDQSDQSAFRRVVIAVIDAFLEAMEMRRVAHGRYSLNDQ